MNRQVENKDATSLVKNEQVSNALGHLLADALLYPFETVLHRLHLQGIATVVDINSKGYKTYSGCKSSCLDKNSILKTY